MPVNAGKSAVLGSVGMGVGELCADDLLALLELEDGTGVLASLGIDKAAAEANITAAVAAIVAAHEQE